MDKLEMLHPHAIREILKQNREDPLNHDTVTDLLIAQLQKIGDSLISRAIVGFDALPKDEQGFWKGYWQAFQNFGQELKKELEG
jgi:hypothetical protein